MLRSMVPWRERFPATFSRFENEMEDLMEHFFGKEGDGLGVMGFTPALDLSETDNAYEVTVELPGLKPEEVHVELKEGQLWISGEKHEEKEKKEQTFHRLERRHGEFRRMVLLPGAVDENKVVAKFAEGVLKVVVPKSEAIKPKRIPIKTT